MLQVTRTKNKGLKSYYVASHHLGATTHLLNLASKPNAELCAAIRAYKFNSVEEAKKAGELFLKSDFVGIFAHKQFMKNYYSISTK